MSAQGVLTHRPTSCLRYAPLIKVVLLSGTIINIECNMGSESMWQYSLLHGYPLLSLDYHKVKTQSLKVLVENLTVLRIESHTQETSIGKLVDIFHTW